MSNVEMSVSSQRMKTVNLTGWKGFLDDKKSWLHTDSPHSCVELGKFADENRSRFPQCKSQVEEAVGEEQERWGILTMDSLWQGDLLSHQNNVPVNMEAPRKLPGSDGFWPAFDF